MRSGYEIDQKRGEAQKMERKEWEKSLHGKLIREIDDIRDELSWDWIRKGFLKIQELLNPFLIKGSHLGPLPLKKPKQLYHFVYHI